jgi:hypothetical protein
VSARFWQAERHARGCADAAYVLKMLCTKSVNWRTWLISYNVLECFVLPALVPWAAVGNFLSGLAGMFMSRPEGMVDDFWLSLFLNFSTFVMLMNMFTYELTTRRADRILFDKTPVPYWRMIEFVVFLLPGLFTCTVPTFVIAAFKVMLNKSEYNTAEKKITYVPQNDKNFEEQTSTKI